MQDRIRSLLTRPVTILVVAAMLLSVATGSAAAFGPVPDAGVMQVWGGGHMWGDGYMSGWRVWGWGMMLFGLVWMALIIGLPIYLVYWLMTREQSDGQGDDRALELLREQYARREIDDDEFDRRRSKLS